MDNAAFGAIGVLNAADSPQNSSTLPLMTLTKLYWSISFHRARILACVFRGIVTLFLAVFRVVKLWE